MSAEWMIFDPAGLDGFAGEGPAIQRAVGDYFEDHYESGAPSPSAMAPNAAFLAALEGKGIARIYLEGRYITLMPDLAAGTENAIITHYEAASAAGVILMVPEGRNPIITSPSGDGLLD